ncbi:EVI5-like protein isoform X2 [Physella acuta]|uniref:EVI5-like protein isoform X2 n=1 Tax=Physella acuta TaxID=109671 RepID=UPI0027DB6EF5|nr:EVI5-like protein isoform X2 [Physella acuta]
MDGRANHSPASDDNSRRSAACGDLAQTSHSPSAHLKKGVMLNGQDKDLNQNFPSPTVGIVVANLPMDAKGDGDGTGEARKPTEEELLQKLEEANRMLEADEKSHVVRAAFSTTPGHSRKGSGSSIVSSTSSNSFYSPQNSNEADENASLAQGRKSFKIKPLSFGNKGNRQVLGKGSDDTDSKKRMSQGRRGSLQTSQNNLGSPDQNIDLTDDVFLGSSSETLWEVWGRIINDWDSVKKKPAFLKELVRKGIPHEFRGMAWQLILGVHDSPFKQEYAEHMKKTSPCEKLIRRDIARTFPDHEFFKVKDGFGQESLFNVMKAYSLHDREVGYCQGSGFIVGLLLMQMPEEDAFAVLVRLMQDFRLRELFKPSMAELGLCMFKLECLMQELLPTLLIHFQTQNFDTSMYASSWFLTLYVTSLPLSLARRIMDLFVSEGMEMIFRVGIAILQSCQEDLLALDMEGLLMYLQKDLRNRFEQEQDQENLLTTAYSIKYSHKKMKKLEKEYTALKTKENEDQIELRRLRTENRLLRQRIENLEKVEAKLLRQKEESATLADKLVQDQVTWAQEVEQSYALRNELSVTRQQLQETQKKLLDAEDIIGDIRKRTRIIEDAVHLDEAEECNMVKYLQEELIAVRLREAETACTIKELKLKISDLEDTNLRLQRAPSNDVQQLQEELIAVKLREAEANLSMKELHMKVNEIETYWESYMERVRQASPKEKSTKSELRHLQEEIMALKLKEARAVGDLKDAKQKLMELETQNQIFTNQIRRMGEDNKEMKRLLEESAEREKDLKVNIKDLTRKLDDTESKRREESMMSRIKEAENVQLLAELRHKIAEIDIQKEELLAAGQLHDKGENQELENKLHDLQDEVLQLQLSFASSNRGKRCVMTDSYLGNNSDEELDAELKESENLDQTLSDIIEGRGLAAHAAPDVENQTQTSQSLSSLEGDEDTQLFSSHKDSVHENQCRESTDSGDSGFKGKSSAPQVKSNSDSLWELYEEVVVLDTNMEGRVVGRNSSNSAGCGDSDVYRGGNGRGVRQGSDERGEVGGRREEDRIPDVVIIYEPSCGLRTPNTDTKDFYLKESRV